MSRWIMVAVTGLILLLVISCGASASSVTTLFGPKQLEGAAGSGLLFGSAEVVITIFETTPTGGTIDFALTNTSLTSELEAGKFANAFITELQFDLPDNFTPIVDSCFVIAEVGVRFAQEPGNPVLATGIERVLDWDFGTGTGGGMYARANEAANFSNNNAIFSDNSLDASDIPVEDYAEGFLRDDWDGAVFDTIIFRVCFENSGPITGDDLPFYQEDHLTAFFQGGEGSVWAPNTLIPEPSTLLLLVSAIPGALWLLVRRRRQ
ncbi:MAG: PEP-CTERM sorting domain-containing protein [Planctomycetota bacterium]